MTAAAVSEVGPRAWPKLNAAERRRGVESLARAVDALVADGGDRGALEVTATIAASGLVLDGAAWTLNVEFPAFETMASVPLRALIAGAFTPAVLNDQQRSDMFAAGVPRPLPLREGLELLAGPASPEAELARRRGARAAAAEAAAAATAAAEAAKRQHDEERARWLALNSERIRQWEALSREGQILFTAADRLPEFRPLLELVAELAAQSPKTIFPMPASFRPGLGRP